jgi:DNA-directed RNA polymerase subunit N (RpoN/RPB10)
MLYPRCPTCGKKLSHLELKYEDKLEDILNNPKLTENQKNVEKQKLVNSLGLTRYCCKTRIITYLDTIKIIK